MNFITLFLYSGLGIDEVIKRDVVVKFVFDNNDVKFLPKFVFDFKRKIFG